MTISAGRLAPRISASILWHTPTLCSKDCRAGVRPASFMRISTYSAASMSFEYVLRLRFPIRPASVPTSRFNDSATTLSPSDRGGSGPDHELPGIRIMQAQLPKQNDTRMPASRGQRTRLSRSPRHSLDPRVAFDSVGASVFGSTYLPPCTARIRPRPTPARVPMLVERGSDRYGWDPR